MSYQYAQPHQKSDRGRETALGCALLVIVCLIVVVLAFACGGPDAEPETPRQAPPVTVTETTTVTVTAPAPPPPVQTQIRQSTVQQPPSLEREEVDLPKPDPAPRVTTEEKSSAYYANCSAARAAGAAPVHVGEPGYGRHLDRDGDGVGCE